MGSTFVKLLFGEKEKSYGSNRSLVRRLGSVLPLKPACGIHLCNEVTDAIAEAGDYFYNTETAQDVLDSYTPKRFTTEVQAASKREGFVVIVQKMNLVEGLTCKILAHIQELERTLQVLSLDEKLQTIEEQLNKTLARLESPSSVYLKQFQESVTLMQPIAPPQPPPSPPPLPPSPTCFFTPPSHLIIRQQKSEQRNLIEVEKHTKARLSLSEALKDLSRVKLRPIQRSPGGNPVRQQPISKHPSSILAAAIKKQFAKLHQEITTEEEGALNDFSLNNE